MAAATARRMRVATTPIIRPLLDLDSTAADCIALLPGAAAPEEWVACGAEPEPRAEATAEPEPEPDTELTLFTSERRILSELVSRARRFKSARMSAACW